MNSLVPALSPEVMERLDAFAYLRACGYSLEDCKEELVKAGLCGDDVSPKSLDREANANWDFFYSKFELHYKRVMVTQAARCQGILMEITEKHWDCDTKIRAGVAFLHHAREVQKLNANDVSSIVQIENPRVAVTDKRKRINELLAKASSNVSQLRANAG